MELLSTLVDFIYKAVLAFAVWHVGEYIITRIMPYTMRLPQIIRKQQIIFFGLRAVTVYVILYILGFDLSGAIAMVASLVGLLILLTWAGVMLGFAISHSGQNMIITYAKRIEEMIVGLFTRR